MDPLNTTKEHSPATYLVAGVALLLVGAIIGVFADPYLPSSLSNSKKEYQAGFTAARTLAENSNFGGMFRKTPDDVRWLVGTVTSIGGGKLTLHTPPGNPFDDQTLVDRTIILDASTKVSFNVKKDPSIYQAGVVTATGTPQQTASVASTTPMKEFPVGFTLTPANVSDIKIGDIIDVIASENVKTQKEFTATEVQIMPRTSSL